MDETLVDVLIIGAGISGIDVAYRLRERCPELTWTIVEARDRLGGTWDLFRYPGVRSDSDMYTLAFPFRPWTGADSIVDGDEILRYVDETAAQTGIAERIEFGTRVVAAAWSTDAAHWRVHAVGASGDREYVARFVVFCTGYYDYEHPYDAGFAGVEDFGGRIVHPQFWPGDLDVTGKRVVVIGSGATAVSIVPALAAKAAHVTMLQRTPSYVLARPRTDPVALQLRRVLPARAAHAIARAKNTTMQWSLVQASRRAPERMRALLRRGAVARTGSAELVDEHFQPPYNPWEQRLCVAPDGDLYTSIREGSVSVVTDHIDRFTRDGMRLQSGRTLEADVVVTATGLRIKLMGGVALTVDGEPADIADSHTYLGALLSGIPNLALCIGYFNLSWTVRADLTARFIARVLRRLLDSGADAVIPTLTAQPDASTPFLDMPSGYVARAADTMPRATARYPWAIRQNVMVDGWATNRARLRKDLVWVKPAAR